MNDKVEAISAELLEYLRLISSHFVGIISVDLGYGTKFDHVCHVNNEHVQLLPNFPFRLSREA